MPLAPKCLKDILYFQGMTLVEFLRALINCKRDQIWDEGENQRSSHLLVPAKVELWPPSPNPLYHTIKPDGAINWYKPTSSTFYKAWIQELLSLGERPSHHSATVSSWENNCVRVEEEEEEDVVVKVEDWRLLPFPDCDQKPSLPIAFGQSRVLSSYYQCTFVTEDDGSLGGNVIGLSFMGSGLKVGGWGV